jgi:hypothetical protein
MIPRLRSKLSYSNVIASLALFVALGGVAVAAGLPRNSVGTKQLKRNAVTAAKLRKGAVTSAKIGRGAVVPGKLSVNSVSTGTIGNGAVTSAKLAKNSVINSAIANGVVGTNKLGNEVVTTAKLDNNAVNTAKLVNNAVTTAKLVNDSVTSAKLAPELGPLLGTLKSGQTLRGVFDIGGSIPGIAGETSYRNSETFQFPLLNTPAVNVLQPGVNSPACPGLGGGNVTPQAAAGQLCIYLTALTPGATVDVDAGSVNRLGFGLLAKFSKGEDDNFALGQWAVTAP